VTLRVNEMTVPDVLRDATGGSFGAQVFIVHGQPGGNPAVGGGWLPPQPVVDFRRPLRMQGGIGPVDHVQGRESCEARLRRGVPTPVLHNPVDKTILYAPGGRQDNFRTGHALHQGRERRRGGGVGKEDVEGRSPKGRRTPSMSRKIITRPSGTFAMVYTVKGGRVVDTRRTKRLEGARKRE
jgi:hypothetical protein